MGARPTAREKELLRLAKEAERLAEAAEANGSFGAARSATQDAAKLRGEAARMRAVRLAEGTRDPVRKLRRLARIAEDEGSWVAAARLQADAQSLEYALDEAAEHEDDTHTLTVDEALQMVLTLIDGLPVGHVRAIGEAVGSRLGVELRDPAEA